MRNTRLLVIKSAVLASTIALLFTGSALFGQETSEKDSEPVYEIGNGVTAPKALYAPNPEYSDKARKKKINGVVVVAMIVTAEGRVRDVKVIKSLEESLDKQAIAAVRAWKFEPATKDGNPVAVHVKAEVDFRLY